MLHDAQLTRTLDRMVEERSLLKHPFYLEWTRGTLERSRLRDYAIQYYRHVEAFPRYLSAIHSRCADIATRQALLENLIEEERGPENHPELWLRFAEGLGVARDRVTGATPTAAAAKLVEHVHPSHARSADRSGTRRAVRLRVADSRGRERQDRRAQALLRGRRGSHAELLQGARRGRRLARPHRCAADRGSRRAQRKRLGGDGSGPRCARRAVGDARQRVDAEPTISADAYADGKSPKRPTGHG